MTNKCKVEYECHQDPCFETRLSGVLIGILRENGINRLRHYSLCTAAHSAYDMISWYKCLLVGLEIAAHSAYDMFTWYKYLLVGLVFSRFDFWSGNLFLIAPFPDLCLLVPFKYLI